MVVVRSVCPAGESHCCAFPAPAQCVRAVYRSPWNVAPILAHAGGVFWRRFNARSARGPHRARRRGRPARPGPGSRGVRRRASRCDATTADSSARTHRFASRPARHPSPSLGLERAGVATQPPIQLDSNYRWDLCVIGAQMHPYGSNGPPQGCRKAWAQREGEVAADRANRIRRGERAMTFRYYIHARMRGFCGRRLWLGETALERRT